MNSKPVYFAYRKKTANQDSGQYAILSDDAKWLYEWHDDGSVWCALQDGMVSTGAYLASDVKEWNPEEFEEKFYPRGHEENNVEN